MQITKFVHQPLRSKTGFSVALNHMAKRCLAALIPFLVSATPLWSSLVEEFSCPWDSKDRHKSVTKSI